MVEIHFSDAPSSTQLIGHNEVIVVVDDSPEIVFLLTHYLQELGFEAIQAGSTEELFALFQQHEIALVLLDIGLPGQDGNEIIQELSGSHPDLGIIMVTGTSDIEVALECMRRGADDYLIKPVPLNLFHYIVENVLKKRRLVINNRTYQKKLQLTNSRLQFLHHLNVKMNSAYLNTFELQCILQAILIGMTSEEGLQFNRAFLALFDSSYQYLVGQLAIGPSSKEEAGEIWHSIKEKGLKFDDILHSVAFEKDNATDKVNLSIKQLKIPITEDNNVLIYSALNKKTISVIKGETHHSEVPKELTELLGCTTFAVAPLYSPTQAYGVIIVDNFITGKAIGKHDIGDLEIFSSQASIAIEHSHLYETMTEKIEELEHITHELEKNRDLLIAAERTSTIGQMSAQLLHSIRNPLTSIGVASRLVTKKNNNKTIEPFLRIISDESQKIETILDDLFSFVESTDLHFSKQAIFPLIRKCVMVFYSAMQDKKIQYDLQLEESGPSLEFDETKIRKSFIQIIRNSIEAMTSGGILTITSSESDSELTILIGDDGPGIPSDTIDQIKQPFFTTKTYGNGLGLALVEQIIKGHHGRFEISNQTKGGTLVALSLPKFISAFNDKRNHP